MVNMSDDELTITHTGNAFKGKADKHQCHRSNSHTQFSTMLDAAVFMLHPSDSVIKFLISLSAVSSPNLLYSHLVLFWGS